MIRHKLACSLSSCDLSEIRRHFRNTIFRFHIPLSIQEWASFVRPSRLRFVPNFHERKHNKTSFFFFKFFLDAIVCETTDGHKIRPVNVLFWHDTGSTLAFSALPLLCFFGYRYNWYRLASRLESKQRCYNHRSYPQPINLSIHQYHWMWNGRWTSRHHHRLIPTAPCLLCRLRFYPFMWRTTATMIVLLFQLRSLTLLDVCRRRRRHLHLTSGIMIVNLLLHLRRVSWKKGLMPLFHRLILPITIDRRLYL